MPTFPTSLKMDGNCPKSICPSCAIDSYSFQTAITSWQADTLVMGPIPSVSGLRTYQAGLAERFSSSVSLRNLLTYEQVSRFRDRNGLEYAYQTIAHKQTFKSQRWGYLQNRHPNQNPRSTKVVELDPYLTYKSVTAQNGMMLAEIHFQFWMGDLDQL